MILNRCLLPSQIVRLFTWTIAAFLWLSYDTNSRRPLHSNDCEALVVPVPQQQPKQRTLTVQIRPVMSSSDLRTIQWILLQEYMNPLSIRAEHLLVAYGSDSDTTTMDDEHDDPNIVSTGTTMLGFGQIRPLNANGSYLELASIYVRPSHRRSGIATRIIQALLEQRASPITWSDPDDAASNEAITNTTKPIIYLLTLRPTMPLYERHGFRLVDDTTMQKMSFVVSSSDPDHVKVPTSLQVEWIIGSIVSKILGNDLVCMMKE